MVVEPSRYSSELTWDPDDTNFDTPEQVYYPVQYVIPGYPANEYSSSDFILLDWICSEKPVKIESLEMSVNASSENGKENNSETKIANKNKSTRRGRHRGRTVSDPTVTSDLPPIPSDLQSLTLLPSANQIVPNNIGVSQYCTLPAPNELPKVILESPPMKNSATKIANKNKSTRRGRRRGRNSCRSVSDPTVTSDLLPIPSDLQSPALLPSANQIVPNNIRVSEYCTLPTPNELPKDVLESPPMENSAASTDDLSNTAVLNDSILDFDKYLLNYQKENDVTFQCLSDPTLLDDVVDALHAISPKESSDLLDCLVADVNLDADVKSVQEDSSNVPVDYVPIELYEEVVYSSDSDVKCDTPSSQSKIINVASQNNKDKDNHKRLDADVESMQEDSSNVPVDYVPIELYEEVVYSSDSDVKCDTPSSQSKIINVASQNNKDKDNHKDDFGLLQITCEITGLSPGEHGFTIYQTGDIRNVE